MNIIKLKDVIMHDKNHKLAKFYNKFLKGKYAWWIQMRYIVPFELMGHEGYVACEEDITKLLLKDDNTYPIPYGCPYVDIYSEDRCIMNYIDHNITDEINNPTKYQLSNTIVPDEDLTIDMLKNFRTWLAQALLDAIKMNKMCTNNSNHDILMSDFSIHTISYYANDMYNDCMKYLAAISEISSNNYNTKTSCGCCESLSKTYNNLNINNCNILNIYKDGLRTHMISILKDVDMWKNLPKTFLMKFRQYIDNILRLDFKVNSSNLPSNIYITCICDNNLNLDNNRVTLQMLLNSLDYLISGTTQGHYNYIKDAFEKWANIYEYMKW